MKMLYGDLSYKIVGCAMTVHNELGYGFLENVYENAFIVELNCAGIPAEQQKKINVIYKNNNVGDYIADIIVANKIIVELKAVKKIASEHVAQTLNYLKATNLKLGIVINFGEKELEYKRLVL